MLKKFGKMYLCFLRENNIDISINFIIISFEIFQLYQKSETQVKTFILFLAKYYNFSCKYKKLTPMLSNSKLHLLMKKKLKNKLLLTTTDKHILKINGFFLNLIV